MKTSAKNNFTRLHLNTFSTLSPGYRDIKTMFWPYCPPLHQAEGRKEGKKVGKEGKERKVGKEGKKRKKEN